MSRPDQDLAQLPDFYFPLQEIIFLALAMLRNRSGENTVPHIYPNFALPCHATIEDFLKLPRVNIKVDEIEVEGTKWHKDFIQVREEDIERWDDFNEANIDSMFGDLLAREVIWDRGHVTSVGVHAHDEFKIVYERHIDIMFEKTIAPVVRKCWGSAAVELQRRVNPRSAMNVAMEYEGVGIRVPAAKTTENDVDSNKVQHLLSPLTSPINKRLLNSKPAEALRTKDGAANPKNSRKKPDWPIYWVRSPNQKTKLPQWDESNKSTKAPQPEDPLCRIHIPLNNGQIAAVGDSKRLYVFDSSNLDEEGMYDEVMVTLGQMAMYSWHGRTRYGFVMNSADVTFLRFFRIADGSRIRLGVQYQILPWISTPGKMPASKGIWALGMLGMNDQHRGIVLKNEMCLLNTWFQFLVKGQIVYVHHLSERIQREIPVGSIIVVGPFEKFRERLNEFSKLAKDLEVMKESAFERDPGSIHLDVLTGVTSSSKVHKATQTHKSSPMSRYTSRRLSTLSKNELRDIIRELSSEEKNKTDMRVSLGKGVKQTR